MEILDVLRKAQTSHNNFADAYQNIAQVLPRLRDRLQDQETIIKDLRDKIARQKSFIESCSVEARPGRKAFKRLPETQEPFSLIEIFCRKPKEEVQLGYEIKKRKANEKHRKVDKERTASEVKIKKPVKGGKAQGGKASNFKTGRSEPLEKTQKTQKTIKDFNKQQIQSASPPRQDLSANASTSLDDIE